MPKRHMKGSRRTCNWKQPWTKTHPYKRKENSLRLQGPHSKSSSPHRAPTSKSKALRPSVKKKIHMKGPVLASSSKSSRPGHWLKQIAITIMPLTPNTTVKLKWYRLLPALLCTSTITEAWIFKANRQKTVKIREGVGKTLRISSAFLVKS